MDLSRLNARQREAVLFGDGPLLVLAGAGSGKTSTMTYRIAHLISERKVPPLAILGLSFTNKAATELKERVLTLLGRTSGFAGVGSLMDLQISTFHSLCVRILRAQGEKIGFRRDFSILDESDQKDVLKQIFKNVKIDDRKFDLDRILFEIGQAKNRFIGGSEAETFFLESGRLPADYALAAASCYQHYQGQLRALNSMDFDDLIFNTVKLLEDSREARTHYNQRFRYLLVDEYQDTNPAQFRLLQLLTEKQKNICVVGDDDQSIYAWRGANATHILEFSSQYKNARTITLDQNYRSTTTILDAANSVIANNRKRHPKTLWSDRGTGEPIEEIILAEDRDESRFVAEEIFRLQADKGRSWSDFAVLYRSNAQSRVFEEALRLNRIPYKIVGGYSFLDRKEVKNTLAIWRLILNPSDDASLRRVINWPTRGVGRTTLEKLSEHAFKSEKPLVGSLRDSGLVPPKAAGEVAKFLDLLEASRLSLSSVGVGGLTGISELMKWAQDTVVQFGIQRALEEESESPAEAARRMENVEELLHALGEIGRATLGQTEEDKNPEGAEGALREFLARMVLDVQEKEEQKEKDEEQNAAAHKKEEVTLLTLHGSKGLEFPVVFMVGAEDGFLPHHRTLEDKTDLSEERRLCYVGITRAKDRLYLSRVKSRVRYGKQIGRTRSRFLDEIPAEMLLSRDESRAGEAPFGKEARKEHEEKVKTYLSDIRSRLMSGKSGSRQV